MPIENLHEKARPYYQTQEEIDRSFPFHSVDRRTYAIRDAAMELVHERQGKGDLVNLVAALIHQKTVLLDEVKLYRDLAKLPDTPPQLEGRPSGE